MIYEHAASIPNPGGVNHPAFADIVRADEGQARLSAHFSGLNYITKVGPPTYADAGEMIKAFVAAAPDQVLWATGWPHYDKVNLPDDALLARSDGRVGAGPGGAQADPGRFPGQAVRVLSGRWQAFDYRRGRDRGVILLQRPVRNADESSALRRSGWSLPASPPL